MICHEGAKPRHDAPKRPENVVRQTPKSAAKIPAPHRRASENQPRPAQSRPAKDIGTAEIEPKTEPLITT
jgi:hypothetical protein